MEGSLAVGISVKNNDSDPVGCLLCDYFRNFHHQRGKIIRMDWRKRKNYHKTPLSFELFNRSVEEGVAMAVMNHKG